MSYRRFTASYFLDGVLIHPANSYSILTCRGCLSAAPVAKAKPNMSQKTKKCDRFTGYVATDDLSCGCVAKTEKINHVRLAS